jgi:flagellar FliL protein
MAASKKGGASAGVDADESDVGSASAKKGSPLKLVLIAVGALVVLGGGAYAGMQMFAGSKDSAHAEEKPVAKAKPAVFLDVPEVLVNLATPANERTQYLKVKIVLELPDSALSAPVQTAMPRVMDTFQTYLREMRPSDLDGSAGLYRLKEELTRRVNAAIAPNRINAVLFKEMVVQ